MTENVEESFPIEHSSLTPGEIQAIAIRATRRNSLAMVSAVLQVVATSAFVIISIILLSSSGAQKAFSERSDCKTTYSSILAAPVTQRDNLQAAVSALSGDLESQLGSALLGLETNVAVPQTVIDTFAATKAALDIKRGELEDSIAKVKQLPTAAQADKNGFTLNNIHYPACPIAN